MVMWVSVMALLLPSGTALRTDSMAQTSESHGTSAKFTSHIIDHYEPYVVEQEAPAIYLPSNVPSHETVGVLLRGAAFRGGHQYTAKDCSDDSIDTQLQATKSVIKFVLVPLLSMPGNRVDVFIARHGLCRHDPKLMELYDEWSSEYKQRTFKYEASNTSQHANMRSALDAVTQHLEDSGSTYKFLIVLRHDIQLERSILEWPANFEKLNFASTCGRFGTWTAAECPGFLNCPPHTLQKCTNDMLMIVPRDHFLAFDKIVGNPQHVCFSSSCPFGHCCNVDFFPAIGAANIGVLFPDPDPLQEDSSICKNEGWFRAYGCLKEQRTVSRLPLSRYCPVLSGECGA
jgi:hypothetical protein